MVAIPFCRCRSEDELQRCTEGIDFCCPDAADEPPIEHVHGSRSRLYCFLTFFRKPHKPSASVIGIGDDLQVAGSLQSPHLFGHRLLCHMRPLGEDARTRSGAVDSQEDLRLRGTHLGKAETGEKVVELAAEPMCRGGHEATQWKWAIPEWISQVLDQHSGPF